MAEEGPVVRALMHIAGAEDATEAGWLGYKIWTSESLDEGLAALSREQLEIAMKVLSIHGGQLAKAYGDQKMEIRHLKSELSTLKET